MKLCNGGIIVLVALYKLYLINAISALVTACITVDISPRINFDAFRCVLLSLALYAITNNLSVQLVNYFQQL